jgi:hypothetical protein
LWPGSLHNPSYTLSLEARTDLPQGCTYSLVETSQTVGAAPMMVIPSGGGSGVLAVTTQDGCGWDARVSGNSSLASKPSTEEAAKIKELLAKAGT